MGGYRRRRRRRRRRCRRRRPRVVVRVLVLAAAATGGGLVGKCDPVSGPVLLVLWCGEGRGKREEGKG
jgi:hypothetical protein